MRSLLQHWITDQAMQHPDSIAVSLEDQSIRYKDLDIQSNRLAHMLKEAGCERSDRVCLLMPKTQETIVCIGGILKADCIYVPLDPGTSAQKLSRMIQKCSPKCVLAAGDVLGLLAETLEKVDEKFLPRVAWVGAQDDFESRPSFQNVNPVFFSEDIQTAISDSLNYSNSSDDPARISFTCKSDEEPKGVVTSHYNNLEFIRWAVNYFKIQADDHLSNFFPTHSDKSTFDIFGALSAGAHLHILPESHKMDPHKVADFISDAGITRWFSTPSILNRMAESDLVKRGAFPSLRSINWSGETFPTDKLRYWMRRLPDVSFTNLYGSKETTVASCYYTVPEMPPSCNAEIPIGKACSGEAFYILDEQLNPVPTGEVGELYISGVGVSQGYWNDEDETLESFQFYPYAFEGDRVFYKTGDYARFEEDGSYYLSNKSEIRILKDGNNVNLRDIENTIKNLEIISECAVVTIPRGDDAGEKKICCAYVPRGSKNNHVAGTYLALKINRLLPNYMIPQQWKSYTILPKNSKGEVDRSELRKRFLSYTSKVDAK